MMGRRKQATIDRRLSIDVTIWVLLLAFCVVAPVSVTVGLADHAHAGIGLYVLSVIIGALIGIVCAVIMFRLHNRAIRRIDTWSTSFQSGVLLVMLGGELLWIVATCAIAWWVFTAVLRQIA